MKRLLAGAAVAALLAFALGGPAAADDGGFEVWAVDQSNTPGTTFGGTLYVYPGPQLMATRRHLRHLSGSISAARRAPCASRSRERTPFART